MQNSSSPLFDYVDRSAVQQFIAEYKVGIEQKAEEALAEALWILVSLAVWPDAFTNKSAVVAGGSARAAEPASKRASQNHRTLSLDD